jgi:glycerol-3-phosphate O-acyltransferase
MPFHRSLPLRNSSRYLSPTLEARRLRNEYNRVQRRLSILHDRRGGETESNNLRTRVDHIARDLGLIRADSAHVIESKLKVAIDLADDKINKSTQKLLASALSDLHYLALMSGPRAE